MYYFFQRKNIISFPKKKTINHHVPLFFWGLSIVGQIGKEPYVLDVSWYPNLGLLMSREMVGAGLTLCLKIKNKKITFLSGWIANNISVIAFPMKSYSESLGALNPNYMFSNL